MVVGSRTGDRPALTPGTILGSRYRIVSLVGRGGMGEVYRADDLKIGQAVALKFLSRPEHTARLYEEVRIGREITHPNVCRLYDVAEVDGRLFITMEFIDGEDLASLLRRVGRLSPEKALAVSHDICAGVAAAHAKGVIHRDLKPANVMIDGRGRARVTDFGLAVAGEATDSSGTPAYMAPEQLEGHPASQMSDLYAIGLVLYEIFTGRRPFEGSSTHELLRRERASEFSRPASVTRDVPPAVEKVILQCLDPEPGARPASVDEVLRELPGGDPLAAAVAAGETPSPAMVAAASRIGDLKPAIAWGLMALAIAGFFLTAILSERTVLSKLRDMKSLDVLEERAREILRAAGISERPRDSDLFVKIERFTDQITVVYRHSPVPMQPYNPRGILSTLDPPLASGMANVELDADGLLRRFIAAPPVIEAAGSAAAPDWSPLLAAAGLDGKVLAPTSPQWASAIVPWSRAAIFVDSDRKLAWRAKDGRRVEASSYHGRPVFFSVITEETTRAATETVRGRTYLPERIADTTIFIFAIALPLAGLILARLHWRRRQGDRAGTFRAAMFFLVTSAVALIFNAHHPMELVAEANLARWLVAYATFWALAVAMMYLAVEPLVRRRWPEMLIGWSRLLAGRFTDPMVGRDVLLGAAGAAVAIVVWQATLIVAGVTGPMAPGTLGSPGVVVASLAYGLAECVLRGVGVVILLVLLRAVLHNDVLASVSMIVLLSLMLLGDTYGPPWLRALYALSAATLGVLLARHFGMLATMAYLFFWLIQQRLPFTLDRDAWFFTRSAVVIAIFCVVVAVAFRISVGTRRWLPRLALE